MFFVLVVVIHMNRKAAVFGENSPFWILDMSSF